MRRVVAAAAVMALVSIGARAAPATNAANGSEMAAFAGEAVSGAECLPGSAVGNAACLDTDRTARMEQWLDGYRTRAGLLGGALALGKTWPEMFGVQIMKSTNYTKLMEPQQKSFPMNFLVL